MNKVDEKRIRFERKMRRRRETLVLTFFYGAITLGCLFALLQIWKIQEQTMKIVSMPLDGFGLSYSIPLALIFAIITGVCFAETIFVAKQYPRK